MKIEYSCDSGQANRAIQPQQPKAGLQVRTDLRSGAWACNTCVGKVTGNQLFKPTCEYCQPA
jgi:hypothetical protein